MSEEQQVSHTMVALDGFETWNAYWTAQGMPWRTEPEIGEERKRYLAERQAMRPDVEKDIYPFRDEQGGIRLARADVEWLAATHNAGAPLPESEGLVLTAVAESDDSIWMRRGPDLRGANLRGVDLTRMYLEYAQLNNAMLAAARLDSAYLAGAHLVGADCAGASLRKANLESANLRNARLQHADLSGADLFQASLGNADLHGANLQGADLAWVYMVNANLVDADITGVRLAEADVAGARLNGIRLDATTATQLLGEIVSRTGMFQSPLPHVDWTTLPFTSIDWAVLFHTAEGGIQFWHDVMTGLAHVPESTSPEAELVKMYRLVARGYYRVATVWQEQGLDEYVDQLRCRAKELRQEVVGRGEDPDYVDPLDDDDNERESGTPI